MFWFIRDHAYPAYIQKASIKKMNFYVPHPHTQGDADIALERKKSTQSEY